MERMIQPAAPCRSCGTTGGYTKPNRNFPYRWKGYCNCCRQRHRRRLAGAQPAGRQPGDPDRRTIDRRAAAIRAERLEHYETAPYRTESARQEIMRPIYRVLMTRRKGIGDF